MTPSGKYIGICVLVGLLAAGSARGQEVGSIVGWGSRVVLPPSALTDLIAIDGTHVSLALKVDGSIVAWGGNNLGQCNVPAPNSDFLAVSAGWYHSLGLKDNGSVVAWGTNQYGQCNVPPPNTDYIAVAAGWYHSLGLKADGSIVAWGRNNYGQCYVPTDPPNTNYMAVARGVYHSLGLKKDGSIVVAGFDARSVLVRTRRAARGLDPPELISHLWPNGFTARRSNRQT